MDIDNIYLGDCLELMKEIPDKSIDCVICDLPYGTTRNQWDSIIPLHELWAEYKRIAKTNAAILLFGQTPFDKVLGASNLDMMKYEWIWKKTRATGHLNAKKMPMKLHENILVFYKNLPTYNPQFTKGYPYVRHCNGHSSNYGYQAGATIVNDGSRYPKSIIEFASVIDGFHPTQKPVELIRYLIRTYTNEGDLILDNCIGSGTTAIACLKEKRHFIGMELNKEYYDVACERIKKEREEIENSLFNI